MDVFSNTTVLLCIIRCGVQAWQKTPVWNNIVNSISLDLLIVIVIQMSWIWKAESCFECTVVPSPCQHGQSLRWLVLKHLFSNALTPGRCVLWQRKQMNMFGPELNFFPPVAVTRCTGHTGQGRYGWHIDVLTESTSAYCWAFLQGTMNHSLCPLVET